VIAYEYTMKIQKLFKVSLPNKNIAFCTN